MRKKLLYMEDLLKFFQSNNLTGFSSADSGYKLSVQVPATFQVEDNVDDAHRGMMRLKFKLFHLFLNRNMSFVSEEAAKDSMPTIKNRPIMAYIHQRDDGEWDFEGHNMSIQTDEDGNEYIEYEEKQVGSFDESEPFFEYDEDLDKTYICAYGYISEDYTRACDIIRRKGGTKNSVELSIEELAYNAKDKYIELKKFYVSASTLLGSTDSGEEIKEGMLGARADIADFSEMNNSVLSNQNDFINKIADAVVSRLGDKAEFSAQNLKEGGKTELDKFNELLEKYKKTIEDITFDYENLTDEELEEAFAKAFDSNEDTEEKTKEQDESPSEDGAGTEEFDGDEPSGSDEPTGGDNDEPTGDDDEPSGESEEDEHQSTSAIEDEDSTGTKIENSLNYSVTIDGVTKCFAISLADKINAITNLVNDTYSEIDNTWYYCDVYEDDGKYCVMHDFWADNHFKQEYSVKKDVYSLKGDRIPVYAQYLTETEIKQLEKMKADYSAIESELNQYKYNELHAKREAIINSDEYSVLKNDKDFKELKENIDKYSLEDLSNKADIIFARYIKAKNKFSADSKDKKESNIVFMDSDANDSGNEKLPYGGLFKNFKTK